MKKLLAALLLVAVVFCGFSLTVSVHMGILQSQGKVVDAGFGAGASVLSYPDDWPMFHHDPQHTGFSTSLPSNGLTLWRFPTDAEVRSSPAVVNGVVYVGSADNNTYALNGATGEKIWNFSTRSQIGSSPAVVGGVVYFGSYVGGVYALNATTGLRIWQQDIGGVSSSPVVVDGVVYIGSGNNRVYAFNATTGAQMWSFFARGEVSSSPAVADGIVYVGSSDYNVYAINATTGAKIWEYATGSYIYSSPAVKAGIVYIGSDDGKLYAFNATTGMKIWEFSAGGDVTTSPTVAGGLVYFTARYGVIYALDASTGVPKWSYQSGSGFTYSSAVVVDNIVYAYLYISSIGHRLCTFDATNGALLGLFPVSTYLFSSPSIVGGVLYFGAFDGYIYALGGMSLSPTSGPPGSNVTFGAVGLRGSALVAATFDGASIPLSSNITDAGGKLVSTFTVPTASAGNHTFAVSDGLNTVSASFWAPPTISLNSSSGAVGSSVTVTANGLVASHLITAKFAGTTVMLSNQTTDAYGNLQASFTVPVSPAGNNTFQLTDGTYTPTATYYVIPTLSLNPSNGRVNSTATISCVGLAVSSQITATFAGSPLTLGGTTTTNAVGSCTVTFVVPNSVAGTKLMVVTDRSGNTASGSFNVTSVIQPITVTMTNSAPVANVTVTGGNPSPASFLADGREHSIIFDEGSALTLSFVNSGGNVRNGFVVSGNFTSVSSLYNASTAPIFVYAYRQLNNTFTVSGLQGNDSITPTSFYGDVIYGDLVTLNSDNSWTASAWSYYNASVVFPGSTANSGSNERWAIGNASRYSTSGLTTSGNTYSQKYYHQCLQTLSYTVLGGGSPAAPVAAGLAFGFGYAPSLTLSGTAYWFDASGAVTFIVSAGSTWERWLPNPSNVSAASSGNLVVNLNHQFQVTFGQANLGSNVLGTVVTVNGAAKTYADLPFSLWFDTSASLTFTYSSAVSSSTTGLQYVLTNANSPSPLTVTNALTITGNYKTQYQVTYARIGLNSDAVDVGNASQRWVDSGTSLAPDFPALVSSSIQGKRYVLSNASASSSLTISAPTTFNVVYITQYQVTLASTPAEGGTITDPSAANLWVNAGGITLSATSNNGYRFSSWNTTGDITVASPSSTSTTVMVNGAGTITADFVTPASDGSGTSDGSGLSDTSGASLPLMLGLAAVIVLSSISAVLAFRWYKRKSP